MKADDRHTLVEMDVDHFLVLSVLVHKYGTGMVATEHGKAIESLSTVGY